MHVSSSNDSYFIGGGQVGIGTRAIPEKLTVAGNISSSGYLSVQGNITGSNLYLSSNIIVDGTVDGVDVLNTSSSYKYRLYFRSHKL